MKPATKSIECPHCGGGVSKGYAVRALAMLAKSDGVDIGDDLESLIDEDLSKGVKKRKGGVSGPTNYAGNEHAATRGPHKMGKVHSSTRGGRGEGVQRHNTPTNYTTEGRKSLFPYVEQYKAVEYLTAEPVEEGVQAELARNLRADLESATGEATR